MCVFCSNFREGEMAAGVHNELQQLSLNGETDADDSNDLNCRTFFRSYTEDGKMYSQCLKCSKTLSGKSKANLERHLTTIHRMKFTNITPKLPKEEITLKIRMGPATVFRAYVHNLTLDGRPLASVNDGGMRMLIDPMLQAFEANKVHIDLSIPRVKKYLTKYSEAVKAAIRQEVKDNIVHVKLDLARRQRKSVLGINVQYMKNDEIVVRTLSMMQTNSGEYICALLMQSLDEYNIKYSQVHTITTDNGTNVLRVVDLLGEVENAEIFADDGCGLNGLFCDERVDDDNMNSSEDSDENDDGVGVSDEDQASLNAAVELFEAKTKILNGIRCAAHTLQLVINTALKQTNNAKKLISKCRRIVKSLLAPNMLNLIRQRNFRSPKIDCLTRWSSTYYMLERFVELKDFYISMISFMPSKCKMNESDWHNLDGILRILRLFESLTKKLQAVNFTVADFYGAWQELKMEMVDLIGVELVDNILVQMEARESEMMQNDIIYSCVFMDPRYRILLTEGISSSNKNRYEGKTNVFTLNTKKILKEIYCCTDVHSMICLFLILNQIKKHVQSNISSVFGKRNAILSVNSIKQSVTISHTLRMRRLLALTGWKCFFAKKKWNCKSLLILTPITLKIN